MRRLSLSVTFTAFALFTGACTRIQDIKGYINDEEMISSVKPGVDNRDSVIKTLGRPTFASEFDPKLWYYVSQRTDQLAFLRPKPTSHQVLIVRFNDKGNVVAIEKLGLDQIVSVNPSNDKTPTSGKEVSVWQQLLGNIGRFSPAGTGGGGGK